jgi:TonB family protein
MSSPLHTVDRLILGLGHFLADFVAPASTPRTEGVIGAAPFAVSPEGIAGRTRLGPDLAVLYRPGVVASVAVFSWGALSLLLGNVGERWAMIPSRDAELVRLEVRQQLESARLAEPRARWFAMVLGGAIVTLILSLGAGRLLGSGAAASFVMLLFGGATWLAANLLLLGSVRRIGERLYRTSVTLEYGYPEKTRLLVALSDAPIAEQRQAATKLLQTLAERGASQWDYLDAQGGRGLGLSFGGGGSQLSALLRRLVRPAIGLAIVWALFSFGPRIFRPITRGLANAWESMTSSADEEIGEEGEGEELERRGLFGSAPEEAVAAAACDPPEDLDCDGSVSMAEIEEYSARAEVDLDSLDDLAPLEAAAPSEVGWDVETAPRGRFRVALDDVDEAGFGDFDMAAVVRMINTRRAAITRCYETQLRANPRLAGRVRVSMTISQTGSVGGVRAVENMTGSHEVASCAVRVVQGFRFNPGPDGGSVTYVFPFVFERAG